jgi:DNA-binding IscR family transcriptional regulator
MENKLTVQYAVQCIEELANDPAGRLSLSDISQRRGIPEDDCRDILDRLEKAGILSIDDRHRFELSRPIEEITSLEVLQALWTERAKFPAFQVLYQSPAKVLRTTLQAVSAAQRVGVFPGEVA